MLGSPGPVTFTSGWSFSSGFLTLRLLGNWLWLKRMAMGGKVWVSWMAKLEAQVQFSNSIPDYQVEGCLAMSSGPDIHNFSQATKKESLLCVTEVGVLMSSFVHGHMVEI